MSYRNCFSFELWVEDESMLEKELYDALASKIKGLPLVQQIWSWLLSFPSINRIFTLVVEQWSYDNSHKQKLTPIVLELRKNNSAWTKFGKDVMRKGAKNLVKSIDFEIEQCMSLISKMCLSFQRKLEREKSIMQHIKVLDIREKAICIQQKCKIHSQNSNKQKKLQ